MTDPTRTISSRITDTAGNTGSSRPTATPAAHAPIKGQVLLIGPFPPPKGGISHHLQRLSRQLDQRGITYEKLDEARQQTDGIANLRRLSFATYFSMIRRARVVHIHSSNRYVRLAHTLVARATGSRVVQTIHGHQDRFLPMIALRLACRLSHRIIAVSAKVRNEMQYTADVIPAFIAPGPADEAIPAPLEAWITCQRSQNRRIIAMNAFRPVRHEGVDLYGIDMLIAALENIAVRERYAAVLCIATIDQDRDYHTQLISRIVHAGLRDQINVQVGSIEFAGVLRRSDVFVRPTITDGDALSIREALWYGLPVIASDAAERPAGTHLFATRNVDQFTDCLIKVAASPQLTGSGGGQDFAADVIKIYIEQLANTSGSGTRTCPQS